MYWSILILAGVCECGFTTCLKLSEGLTKLGWAVAFLALSTVSFGLLTLAAQKISLGTAYAVWTGIGAFGTALIGILWFKDPATFWRVFFLCGLIACLIGLKLASPEREELSVISGQSSVENSATPDAHEGANPGSGLGTDN